MSYTDPPVLSCISSFSVPAFTQIWYLWVMLYSSRRRRLAQAQPHVAMKSQEYHITGRMPLSNNIPWHKSPLSWIQWNFCFCGIRENTERTRQVPHSKVSSSSDRSPQLTKKNTWRLFVNATYRGCGRYRGLSIIAQACRMFRGLQMRSSQHSTTYRLSTPSLLHETGYAPNLAMGAPSVFQNMRRNEVPRVLLLLSIKSTTVYLNEGFNRKTSRINVCYYP